MGKLHRNQPSAIYKGTSANNASPLMTLRCDVMRSNSNDSKQEFRIGLEMPKRKITNYVYYMNYKLNNYSNTTTNLDLESYFRICDRTWSAMTEEEKKQWKIKLQANRHFEIHQQLFAFLHNLQLEKRNVHRPVPFQQVFQPYEVTDANQMESLRRQQSFLFLNLLKLSMKNSMLQFSCAFISVSFSGRAAITSKYLEIQLLKFTLEQGVTEVVGDSYFTKEWSLPSNVKEILHETSYLFCEGTKFSAVIEVMKFIWMNEKRLGIPPKVLFIEDFLNTFRLCNEHKCNEDMILPPLMNYRPMQLKLDISCSYHKMQYMTGFPCALKEAFIALENVFREIQNMQPNHFKIGKLLESLEQHGGKNTYPFRSQVAEENEVPLIRFDEEAHEEPKTDQGKEEQTQTQFPRFKKPTQQCDDLAHTNFYKALFGGTPEVPLNFPFDDEFIQVPNSFDDITPKQFYKELFEELKDPFGEEAEAGKENDLIIL
ncbi:hypothetical protein T4D_3153 [Trichinella pseudospiralis]|uniref:Uncharacterized protein n=1 Tax=Trichinella pseudospiralis TaxID=6337 RepID=A0A0V1FGC2_TRIPS|nr:hypothetical protein T4D_3153 [Trichinella pseudospiralis]